MVSNLCSFFFKNSLSRIFYSVVVFVVSALFIFTPQAFCLITNLPENKNLISDAVTYAFDGDVDGLVATFDSLDQSIESSEDPMEEIQNIFQLFIDEVNSRCSLNLTLEDACNLVRNNIASLQLTEEIEMLVLETIALVLGESNLDCYSEEGFSDLQISDITS
jgi:hypothetical protein